MRKLLTALTWALTPAVGSASAALAAADEEAPCLGENARTFAPALRGDFGQLVVAPEAQAGLTGEVASTNTRAEC